MKISVKYGKATVDVTVPEDATLGMFKAELEKLTSVPRTLQKLTGKPNLKDDDRSPKARYHKPCVSAPGCPRVQLLTT